MNKRFSVLTLAGAALFSLSIAASASAGVVDTCAGCHGTDGTSKDSKLPVIGGMSAEYIKGTLEGYKSGDRKACPSFTVSSGSKKGTKTDMCQVAKGLSDADIKEAADHYASKPFVRVKQTTDAALAKKGKEIFEQSCEKCHSEGGSVKSDDTSILSGQWMSYIKDQIADFQADKRTKPEKMIPKIKKLEPADVDAVVQYLGSDK